MRTRWDAVWAVLKDVVLTSTGVWIVVLQALSPHPSDPLLVVAMALCVPAIYDHARAITGAGGPGVHPPGHGGGTPPGPRPSSPSAPSSAPLPSSSSEGGSDA